MRPAFHKPQGFPQLIDIVVLLLDFGLCHAQLSLGFFSAKKVQLHCRYRLTIAFLLPVRRISSASAYMLFIGYSFLEISALQSLAPFCRFAASGFITIRCSLHLLSTSSSPRKQLFRISTIAIAGAPHILQIFFVGIRNFVTSPILGYFLNIITRPFLPLLRL